MKRFIPFFCFFLLIALSAQAENYLINGGQESSIKYAQERVQFGKPIGGHQLIQETDMDPQAGFVFKFGLFFRRFSVS